MRRPDKKDGEDEDGEESSTHTNLEATFDAARRSAAIESGSTTASETEGSDDEDEGEGTWAEPLHTKGLYKVAKEHHPDEHAGMLKALRLKKRAERQVQNVANETQDKKRNKKANTALLHATMQYSKIRLQVLRQAWYTEVAQKSPRGKRDPKPVVLSKTKAKQVLPQLH